MRPSLRAIITLATVSAFAAAPTTEPNYVSRPCPWCGRETRAFDKEQRIHHEAPVCARFAEEVRRHNGVWDPPPPPQDIVKEFKASQQQYEASQQAHREHETWAAAQAKRERKAAKAREDARRREEGRRHG